MTDHIPEQAKAAVLEAIAANAWRLTTDARVLQASGSAGSTLSFAILAFEEAGSRLRHPRLTSTLCRSQFPRAPELWLSST